MLIISKIWILAQAFLYIGISFISFFKPYYVAETIGLSITRAGGIAEIKACYGGLMFVIGAIMLWLMFKDRISESLMLLLLTYLGFGTGRLIGIIGSRAFDSTTLTYVTFESLTVIISWILLTQLPTR